MKINQRNITYYRNWGYDAKIGEKILVLVEHLTNGSKIKVTKICDYAECDEEGGRKSNTSYSNVQNERKLNEIDLCYKCAHTVGWARRKENIKYENSLEFYATNNNKEYLLLEFSNKNIKSPREVSLSTLDKYLWNCPKCNSEYDVSISSRTNCDSACPYCHGRRVNHTNCLWATHPSIASLLLDCEDGYKYTMGTHKKVNFKCLDCDYKIKNKSIANVIHQGLSCPRCSDGYSYPEKIMFNVLSQMDIYFEFQKTFAWSINKKYDFYVPSLNCIIETHGAQHYRHTGFSRSLEQEQENDRLKKKLAKENEFEYYITIDCSVSDLEYIKKNIIKSKLSHLLTLGKVDWLTCDKYACHSLVKTVCKMWNTKYSIEDIMKQLKISRYPVIKYLKQGTSLGWCNYDPKEEVVISNKKNKNAKKAVVMLSLNGEYIDEFESAADAERKTGISSACISSVCRKIRSTTKNFRFMFKDEYEKTKENITPYKKKKRRNSRSIIQLSLDNKLYIREWESITDIQKDLNINNISRVCNGKQQSAGGFRWMFKKDYDDLLLEQPTT